MTTRMLIVTAVLVASAGAVQWMSRPELRAARSPLRDMPMAIGDWQGRDNKEFDAKTLKVLGVDDYITRLYVSNQQKAVSLYIGYYESQRTGDTMHSPMRCLPGTGWQPLATGVRPLQVQTSAASGAGQTITINRYLVQKGLQRHIVLFWYQMHGRVIASEYATKVFLIRDAVQMNRTDGALVRVIIPIAESEGEEAADRAVTTFVRQLFPLLPSFLPA